MGRPLIGITGEFQQPRNGSCGYTTIYSGYYDSVSAANGIPVVLPPVGTATEVNAVLRHMKGVVLAGSRKDLDPQRDGWQRHRTTHAMHPRREDFDRLLIRSIVAKKIPVFAIGVGMQLLNVHCGGQLSLDISEDFPAALCHRDPDQDVQHRHQIFVVPGSWIHGIYGDGHALVTSYHHMAVQELAPEFEVSAQAPDGVIEAIESSKKGWFAVGVQFHPETTGATALDQRLFEEFVQVCTKK